MRTALYRLRRCPLGSVGLWLWTAALLAGSAWADQPPTGRSLAVEMGCINCHGSARGAPPLDRLAARYAGQRGEQGAAARLAAHLRQPDAEHRVVVHEQLSPQTAQQLMQWLLDGAK